VIRREFNGVSTPVPLIRQKPIYVSFHFVIGEFDLVYFLAPLVAIPFGDIEEYISNLGATETLQNVVSNGYLFKPGAQKFSKNLVTSSKCYVPEQCHEAGSMLRTHKYYAPRYEI